MIMKVEKIYGKEQFTSNYSTSNGHSVSKVEATQKGGVNGFSPEQPSPNNFKRIGIYIALLLLGFLLGYFLFSNSNMSNGEVKSIENVNEAQLWTCSMHPQITQPDAGDCPLCGMDLIPAEKGAEGLAPEQFKLTKNAMALANIQTTVIGETIVNNNNQAINLSGKIVVNETVNSVQVSHITGRIESLYVNFIGEKVGKGQQLASIYSPELFSAQQELLTAVSLKETQPELYYAVRNKLKLWKLTDDQINQIEVSNQITENVPVYATESGTVTQKMINRGDYVSKGQPLLELANYSSVWADFDVYENQISYFKVGQTISINAGAYPNKTFKAKVTFIDPVLNVQKRTITLRAELNNRNRRLKPGMFVTGTVKTEALQNQQVVSIPATAIMWTGKRSLVYVKVNPSEPVFEMREVVVGNQSQGVYEILGGLKTGEEIVTNGVFTVDASAQLQGKRAMMNHTKEEIEMPVQRIKVSSKFQKQLNTVVNTYLLMKDALVEHDSLTVLKTSGLLINKLAKINSKLLKDSSVKNQWNTLDQIIKASVDTMGKTTNLNIQRKQFKTLSSHLIEAVETFGTDKKLYSQFCPMADHDTGGYWLSKEEKIVNPYFGDMMLSCGEVKQIIE